MSKLFFWIPSIVWMGVIFLLSSHESTRVSADYWWNFLFFKTLHVIEFSILFTLYVHALKKTYPKKNGINFFAAAFILTLIYAAIDEIHQLFVPTREGRVRDVIIDGLGAALAWIFLSKLLPKTPKKLQILAKRWGLSS